MTVGNTYTSTNTQAGASCFVGTPSGGNLANVLRELPEHRELTEGGTQHVSLNTTISLGIPISWRCTAPASSRSGVSRRRPR